MASYVLITDPVHRRVSTEPNRIQRSNSPKISKLCVGLFSERMARLEIRASGQQVVTMVWSGEVLLLLDVLYSDLPQKRHHREDLIMVSLSPFKL